MKVTVSIRPDPPLHVSASCQERHHPSQGTAVAGKKKPTTFLWLLLQIPQAISRESATSLKPLTHSLKRFTSLLTLFLITRNAPTCRPSCPSVCTTPPSASAGVAFAGHKSAPWLPQTPLKHPVASRAKEFVLWLKSCRRRETPSPQHSFDDFEIIVFYIYIHTHIYIATQTAWSILHLNYSQADKHYGRQPRPR